MAARLSPFPSESATAVTLRQLPVSQGPGPLPLDAVPWLMISFAELRELALDHRQGFLVSLLDGRMTLDALLDVSGMPRDVALEMIEQLVADGVVALR